MIWETFGEIETLIGVFGTLSGLLVRISLQPSSNEAKAARRMQFLVWTAKVKRLWADVERIAGLIGKIE